MSGIIELPVGGPHALDPLHVTGMYSVTLISVTRTSEPHQQSAETSLFTADTAQARVLAQELELDWAPIVLTGTFRWLWPNRIHEDSIVGYISRDQQLRLDSRPTGGRFHITHADGDSLRGWWNIGDASITPESLGYFCARR